MAHASAQAPKFEWDFDVPETPFWKNMEFTVARNFLTCFEQHEIDAMQLDTKAKLSVAQRVGLLLSQLQSRLSSTPEKTDTWRRLMLGVETMQKQLGLTDDEAETIKAVLRCTEGNARVPWLNMLAGLDMRIAKFAEAEALAKEVLPWMQTHEKLGKDSPQAFGTTRTIIECLSNQKGKEDETRALVNETFALIDAMRGRKFAKYQDEEREMLQELVKRLSIVL